MKPTREQCIEWSREAGLDWHRGFVVSDDDNRYEALCTLVWNAAIEEAAKSIVGYGEASYIVSNLQVTK